MPRSIEIGRAVLSTPASNLELWLRTLITISPQQECANIERYNAALLLGLFSSGEAWVGRGSGLYIDLDLSLQGYPIADEQLQHLSTAILDAPVWNQLNLQPSVPHRTGRVPGKLRIAVNHSSEKGVPGDKQHHRILMDVPGADIQPPEGVPVFYLDSVHLAMDIFETALQRKAKRPKTSKNSNDSSHAINTRPSSTNKQYVLDELLLEAGDMNTLPTLSPNLKRTRSLSSCTKKPFMQITSPRRILNDNDLNTGSLELRTGTESSEISVNMAAMQFLVDAALRLSVTSHINSRSTPGVKVKANTFGPGLAEIAPTLWRPGYLQALSQRANLLSVISRSLCRSAEKVISTTLRDDFSVLMMPLPSSSFQMMDQGISSSVSARLWLQLQKNTLNKSPTPLHLFTAAEPPFIAPVQPECRLENTTQESGIDRTPVTIGANKIVQSSSAVSANQESFLLEACILGCQVGPGDTFGPVDEDLLLGDNCFEPLSPTIDCGLQTL